MPTLTLPAPTSTLGLLPPYLFAELDRKIAAARANGVDIISLGVGDPDLPTPQPIVEEMMRAVQDPKNHVYPAYKGSPAFCQAVTQWMDTRFGVNIDPDTETMALIGAKEGLAHLILGYIQKGDVVLCPSPAYPVYRNYTLLCGGEPYTVPLTRENNFVPDVDAIPSDIARKAKLFFLNYPNNPTGAIITPEAIAKIVAFCQQYDIILCHDNAYSEMTFDGYNAPSFLTTPGAKDVTIELFSFSKMFNMTGWRIGFAVGNAEVVKTLGTIKNNTDSGAFTAIQQAAAYGLGDYQALTAGHNSTYGKRRDLFVAGLQQLGFPVVPMQATFYLWVPVPAGWTSAAFATHLLDTCGIVVPPGNGYGPEGEGFFRVALTASEARLKEALQRMQDKGIRYDMPPVSA